MQRTHQGGTVTAPVPDHTKLRIGSLQAIIRQAGIDRQAFEV
ncbi:MAG: hypothetical protein F9K47_17440 [Burkholderiales bacterium]|nr:MAG: hypothetical protein F9K47_17440 [Burkholderiales bacterium]